MEQLKLVERENYGNYETIVSDVNIIEVRVEGKIHSLWYGSCPLPRNLNPEKNKNPVE